MTDEEEELFQKVIDLKKERDMLYVIFEEVNELVKSGYDGPFMGEEVRGIFYSINEYNKWKATRKK